MGLSRIQQFIRICVSCHGNIESSYSGQIKADMYRHSEISTQPIITLNFAATVLLCPIFNSYWLWRAWKVIGVVHGVDDVYCMDALHPDRNTATTKYCHSPRSPTCSLGYLASLDPRQAAVEQSPCRQARSSRQPDLMDLPFTTLLNSSSRERVHSIY